ncbi:MAG TPA: NAD+ synthase [Acidimicrobiia bacterium]|nr:NAD+ synthase [Acidimicrobiia bacterium]
MTDFIRLAGAQINLTVGDLDGNVERILEAMAWAEELQADVLLLPELAVTGYPPEDLVLRRRFIEANTQAVYRLAAKSGQTTTVVGFVDRTQGSAKRDDAGPGRLHNAAGLLAGGRLRGVYHKVLLPNYGVFDEDRYFFPGAAPAALWEVNGAVAGVSICEDIWVADGPPAQQTAAGADILLNINGSPYHRNKDAEREEMLRSRARAGRVPLAYLNLVGGQDELVFDGGSLVIDAAGEVLYRAPQFEEELFWVDVPLSEEGRSDVQATVVSRGTLLEGEPAALPDLREPLDATEEVYRALCLGLGDYFRKVGFARVVLGLSGGIDSALVASIAADAVGPELVWGVAMPSRYSSEGSVADARALAANLGIRLWEIPIEPPFAGFLEALDEAFSGTEAGVAEENLQARARGSILMALSNKHGGLVLATGNKSEMSVGYSTLYGDMVGGYAVLKDVSKTLVYELAKWRNRDGEVIPEATIAKAPSAELKPGQRDTDSLPPYSTLDPILEAYVEKDLAVEDIVKAGFNRGVVERVARMVDHNEYKRRQSPPGVKITPKALGRDRRLPIVNGFQG